MTMCRDNGLEGTTVHSEDENQHLSYIMDWIGSCGSVHLSLGKIGTGPGRETGLEKCYTMCTNNKLQMITVHSVAELTKLKQNFGRFKNRNLHIGMTNIQKGIKFSSAWRDGSALNYANWAGGEPSFIVPHEWTAETIRENCTVMALNGLWNDVSCLVNATSNLGACACMKEC
ncbi:unnamed protein product, partial [Mesorhabditis spiculigera]